MLSNNDILKKLRVALSLRNDDIIEILSLVDFEITKGALGDLFRNEDHPGYVEAGDQDGLGEHPRHDAEADEHPG